MLYSFLALIDISHDNITTNSVILADVLSEDIIMKWYKESHSSKGKSVFLEQMKKFIEWLQNAEEGKYFWKIMWKIAIMNIQGLTYKSASFSFRIRKWERELNKTYC